MRTSMRVRLGLGLALAGLFGARGASATTVLEQGDNGSEQMGRGGAWVARASDPLAAFYNPAGLAGQETRLTLQGNINILSTCFTRLKATNDATSGDGNPSTGATVPAGSSFPQVCNGYNPTPTSLLVPQLAFTYRLTPRIGIGLAIVTPSAAPASTNWPTTLSDGSPSPQRYLLLSATTVVVTPTIGVGWEPIDRLRIGASFIWGIASVDFQNDSWVQNGGTLGPNGAPVPPYITPASNDLHGEINAQQYFIPGFTAGAIWSPSDQVDIAGWYKFMSSIDAKGYVNTTYGTGKSTVTGTTTETNCGIQGGAALCGPNDAEVKVPIPMEAKLGVRFHKIRPGADMLHRRDPMSQDVFDVEADFTWANDSSFQAINLSFPGNNGIGTIPVNGPPGNLPENASVPHNFKDVFGIRIGGDVNVLPDQLAIRAGGYFQTAAQDSQYQNIDFPGQQEFGLAAALTTRIHLDKLFGTTSKSPALELSIGFGHTWIGTSINDGPNGVSALSGTQCNPGPNGTNTAPPNNGYVPCSDGKPQYRTEWPVNLGTITNSFNQINLGGSYRF
jgi:long-subunit fatty acid transport protein